MSFREELIAAKRRKQAERNYAMVVEIRLARGHSLDDIPQASSNLRAESHQRSPEWISVRKTHLIKHPCCAACGWSEMNGKQKVQVHHIMPFCLYPQAELDPNNLISLCEIGIDGCHSNFGHPLGTQSYNPYVLQHTAILNKTFSRLEEIMELARMSAVLVLR